MKVHGSCHCQQIRYEAMVDPESASICHCTDCQKLSGTAYRVNVRAQQGTLRIFQGEPKMYVKIGSSGSRRAQMFCANCGSQLFVTDADQPGDYRLRVGCLEERAALEPKVQIWFQSALPWTQSIEAVAQRETV